MAIWLIKTIGRDEQGRVQCTLYYDDTEIGTDTLLPLMELIESDGADGDTVIEQRANGKETARYTVAEARRGKQECDRYLAGLEQNDAAA